jgi:hypothetical protein
MKHDFINFGGTTIRVSEIALLGPVAHERNPQNSGEQRFYLEIEVKSGTKLRLNTPYMDSSARMSKEDERLRGAFWGGMKDIRATIEHIINQESGADIPTFDVRLALAN